MEIHIKLIAYFDRLPDEAKLITLKTFKIILNSWLIGNLFCKTDEFVNRHYILILT